MAIEKRHYKKKSNKLFVWIAVAMVAMIVVLIILSKKGVIGDSNMIEVETDVVSKRSISEVITASGKLRPEKELSISSDVPGEIIELSVKEGDRVKKGDLLLRIKPDEFKSNVDDAIASYNSSLAGLENAKANLEQSSAYLEKSKTLYDRYAVLKEKSAVSDTEFERVESEYLGAKAQYESARQGVETAKYSIVSAAARKQKAFESLSKTSIYSPIDGIVTRLNNQEGEKVVGTAQMAGTVILRLADLSQMVVNIDVNENDIIRISLGDTADIEVDAFLNEKFRGTVTEIANSSKDNVGGVDQITTFDIKVKLIEESYAHLIDTTKTVKTPFRPGMSAMVDVHTNSAIGVISVPILSVTTRFINPEGDEDEGRKKKEEDENNKSEVVFLFEDGETKMKQVEIGMQDDYYIEILEGLEEGQVVVSGPYSIVSKILKDGQSVKEKDKKKEDD
ncbi:MAG: efflux RND transporter periplasmic adaptor subunit [Bacteroidetes bacterium]|nr:efflux RND transporter periplasmic adaptor subunit [Bacteroidota bacterium]